MASYINVFLKTEITVIPSLLDKYIGKYYNNTLCNGASWMFLSWCILHVIFDDLINALLRKMRYKEYERIRLKNSLWYLGFYSTACIYCIATFLQNNTQFYTKYLFDSTNTSSGHLILGFIVLCTFYLHSAFWERLKYHHGAVALKYFCLFLLSCFSYFLRFVEGVFRLTILMSYTQIALELTRCSAVLIKKEGFVRSTICGILFMSCIFFFVVNYLVVIYFLLDPLVRTFTPSTGILMFFLMSCLVLEIYESVLFKAIVHWLNHKEEFNCKKDLLECALFQPRNDATYNFLILREEIKEREEKYMSLRRPKNRNMVVQTLKCMVAIKRKLNEKRQSATSSNEDDDGSGASSPELETIENTKDVENLVEKEENENNNKSDIIDQAEDVDKNCHERLSMSDTQLKTSANDDTEDGRNNVLDAVFKHHVNATESNEHIKKCKED